MDIPTIIKSFQEIPDIEKNTFELTSLFIIYLLKWLVDSTTEANRQFHDIVNYSRYIPDFNVSNEESKLLPRDQDLEVKLRELTPKILIYVYNCLEELRIALENNNPESDLYIITILKDELNRPDSELRLAIITKIIKSPLFQNLDMMKDGNINRNDQLIELSDNILSSLDLIKMEGGSKFEQRFIVSFTAQMLRVIKGTWDKSERS